MAAYEDALHSSRIKRNIGNKQSAWNCSVEKLSQQNSYAAKLQKKVIRLPFKANKKTKE